MAADLDANVDATWLLTWMPPGRYRGCHVAAYSDGFNDMDNDAVCHVAAILDDIDDVA
jgi:hypothetical protein